MKVLVTGATGFLGTAISKQLLIEGYSVRCHYRRQSQIEQLRSRISSINSKSSSVEYVQQDLLSISKESLIQLIDGCSMIVHNAAYVRDWGTSKQAWKLNVDATRDILEAAIALNIKRFVYISSIAVHGLKSCDCITEEGPYNRLFNVYEKSKLAAEQTIHDTATRLQFTDYVIIRPGSIYGLFDTTIYYKIFTAIKKRALPYIGNKHGVLPLIHCTDVARAVSCALTAAKHATGQVYNIVSDELVDFHTLFNFISSKLNVPPPFIVLPTWCAILIAWITNMIRFIFRLPFEPIVTVFRIRSMIHKRVFDTRRSKRLLRFTPAIRWQDGFSEAIADYQQSEQISKK